jgi:hypothetical protein
LIPASGDQDHTILPSAGGSRSSGAPPRPSHPAANVRDDREAPLLRKRDARDNHIFLKNGSAIFAMRAAARRIELSRLAKSVFWRGRFRACKAPSGGGPTTETDQTDLPVGQNQLALVLERDEIWLNRHCEPTGRANARPMTGSTKQSISTHDSTMDASYLPGGWM